MPDKASLTKLRDHLWDPALPARASVFAILDGARDRRIYGAVDGTSSEKCCLFAGDLHWELAMVAPYLVQLDRDDRFTRYILEKGWGQNWGIFLRTETGMPQLRRHLRSFLRVRSESGEAMLFRYYDPRVLRHYLPTCQAKELELVFGPLAYYMVEDDDGRQALRFTFRRGHLETERLQIAELDPA